jgi:hypothetical protein
MPFGTMVFCVICTLTAVPFLLLNTSCIVQGAVTHDIARTKREKGSVPCEEITQVKHDGQLPAPSAHVGPKGTIEL